MSRRLKGGIVRTCRDERTADGKRCRRFQEALYAQWPQLPPIALSLVREAARLDLELFHAGSELDVARQQRRRRDVARLRRQLTPMRGQLTRLLEQIETLSKTSPLSFAEAARRAAGTHTSGDGR